MKPFKFHHHSIINLFLNIYVVTMTSLVGFGIIMIVSNLIMGNVPGSFGIYG